MVLALRLVNGGNPNEPAVSAIFFLLYFFLFVFPVVKRIFCNDS
jgi:hypothetical protein